MMSTMSTVPPRQSNAHNPRWWSSITDECPITLEPLSDLPYPPFALPRKSDGGAYYFDGLALASYAVSRGTFQNPLTREPLTWDDCRNLDVFLEENVYHCASESISSRICVCEAYGLRESVRVGRPSQGRSSRLRQWSADAPEGLEDEGGDTSSPGEEHHRLTDDDIRRAEALRSEAAAALRGLFVFGHRRGGARGGTIRDSGRYSDAASGLGREEGHHIPTVGFDLRHPIGVGRDVSVADPVGASIEVEGLRIIDDDEVVAHSSDREAWRELQKSFPPIDGIHLEEEITTSGASSGADEPGSPSPLLQKARETAERTQKEERERRYLIDRCRRKAFSDALIRKQERLQLREEERRRRLQERQREDEENEQLRLARAEIDQWRADQWEEMVRLTEDRKETMEILSPRADASKAQMDTSAAPELPASVDKSRQEQLVEEQKDAAAAKKAAKAAAKRRRARERAKEKKRIEKEAKQKAAKEAANQEKKKASAVKCGCCGEGVLDGGFEKFGVKYCSPKCARTGPRQGV